MIGTPPTALSFIFYVDGVGVSEEKGGRDASFFLVLFLFLQGGAERKEVGVTPQHFLACFPRTIGWYFGGTAVF